MRDPLTADEITHGTGTLSARSVGGGLYDYFCRACGGYAGPTPYTSHERLTASSNSARASTRSPLTRKVRTRMGDRSRLYISNVIDTAYTTDGAWGYSFTSWMNHDLDPLFIPCEHSTSRLFGRARTCRRTLEEHMLADLGHTYVKDRTWETADVR